jgi:hypothetical protein
MVNDKKPAINPARQPGRRRRPIVRRQALSTRHATHQDFNEFRKEVMGLFQRFSDEVKGWMGDLDDRLLKQGTVNYGNWLAFAGLVAILAGMAATLTNVIVGNEKAQRELQLIGLTEKNAETIKRLDAALQHERELSSTKDDLRQQMFFEIVARLENMINVNAQKE